jgi:pentatricopeptide repeat protein
LFEKLEKTPLQADRGTYLVMLEASLNDGDFQEARNLVSQMNERNFETLIDVQRMFLRGYLQHGKIAEAKQWFRDVRDAGMEADTESWNLLLKHYADEHKLKQCSAYLKAMKRNNAKPDENSYGVLIEGYLAVGNAIKAEKFLSQLMADNITPTHSLAEQVCIKLVELERFESAKTFLEYVLEKEVNVNISHLIDSHNLKKRAPKGFVPLIRKVAALPVPQVHGSQHSEQALKNAILDSLSNLGHEWKEAMEGGDLGEEDVLDDELSGDEDEIRALGELLDAYDAVQKGELETDSEKLDSSLQKVLSLYSSSGNGFVYAESSRQQAGHLLNQSDEDDFELDNPNEEINEYHDDTYNYALFTGKKKDDDDDESEDEESLAPTDPKDPRWETWSWTDTEEDVVNDMERLRRLKEEKEAALRRFGLEPIEEEEEVDEDESVSQPVEAVRREFLDSDDEDFSFGLTEEVSSIVSGKRSVDLFKALFDDSDEEGGDKNSDDEDLDF